MNNRLLLHSLTKLCGTSLKQVASATGVRLSRLREAAEGWPLREANQEAVNAYAKWLLRDAYTAASKRLLALPELRSHPASQRYLSDLESAYQTAFGVALLDDGEVCK